jgi:hypothetical protein
VSTDTLKAPRDEAGATNSIDCRALSVIPSTQDKFSYSGDTSTACKTGPACSKWLLTWRKETGGTGEVRSRRTAEAVATTPVITAAANGVSQINISWTPADQAVSYELQRSTTTGFSAPTTAQYTAVASTATGLTPNTTYYFRVRAVLPSSTSAWSNVAQAKTADLTAPTGTPSVTAVMSGANARGAVSGGVCQTGTTIAYEIRYQVNGGAWQAYTAGSTRDVAATEGATYSFQARARCTLGASVSGYGAESAVVSVTRPVAIPTGASLTAAMSGASAVATSSAGTCASGATIEQQIRYNSSPTAAAGTWSAYVVGASRTVAALEGHKYSFEQQVRCVGVNASSGWTAGGSASVIRPITTIPATPAVTAATSGDTTTFSWNAATCTSGVTPYYQGVSTADWGYEVEWGPYTGYLTRNWSSASQGYQYTMTVRVQCKTAHASSPLSGTGTRSYIRPIDAPGAATAFKHVVASGRKSRKYTWTAPTCGPGARAESESNSWIGVQKPSAGGSMTWTATGKNGWLYSTTYGNRGYWTAEYSSTMTTGTVPSDIEVRHRIRYVCVNATTGRQSAWGPDALSAIFKT